ncbi:NYN domain-containing protein [Clostridium sp. DL1XJH146]
MKYVFVDGYNVINCWPGLKKTKDFSFEMARAELIDNLQDYSSYKGVKMFIVFDAHLVHGSLEKVDKIGNIHIVFTKEGETADSFIEKYISKIGRKVDVSVVTNDSLEQQLIFQRGATRVPSLEFYHEVLKTKKIIKKQTKKSETKSKNFLHERIDSEIANKLEKIRRSK